MPSQDVEFDAIADTGGKFARLAKLLGLADADHALGRMTHLWMACTTRGETDLPQWLVEQVLGERGPDALVEVELARWARGRGDSKTRRMYICGAKKHCTWMRRNQEQSPKGGRTRAENSSRVAGRFVADRAGENATPEPAPSPSPLPSFPSPDQDLGDAPASPPLPTEPSGPNPLTLQPSPARPPRPAKTQKRQLPATWSPRPQERERARAAGIDPDHEAERFRDHHTARANTMADWDAAFRTWIGNAPRFADGTRAGPRGSAERALRTGRVEPRTHTDYPDGDQPL